jgi:hypothetical protein
LPYAAFTALEMAFGRRKKSREEEKPVVMLDSGEHSKQIKRRRSRDEDKQFRDEKRQRVSFLGSTMVTCLRSELIRRTLRLVCVCRFLCRQTDQSDGKSSVPEYQLQLGRQHLLSRIDLLLPLEGTIRYQGPFAERDASMWLFAETSSTEHPLLVWVVQDGHFIYELGDNLTSRCKSTDKICLAAITVILG